MVGHIRDTATPRTTPFDPWIDPSLTTRIADLRGGVRQSFAQGDAVSAVDVVVVSLLSELPSAIGVLSG